MAGACAVVLGLIAGCGGDAHDLETPLGTASSPIISGGFSPATRDFILELGLEVDGAMGPSCSSSLVAPNLLLTARHCVGELDPTGSSIVKEFAPSSLGAYIGPSGSHRASVGAAPDARGAQIIKMPGTTVSPDVAFVVLDRPLDAPLGRLRLGGNAKKNEAVSIAGFGLTEKDGTPSQRLERNNVLVIAVAPEPTSFEPLSPGEFATTEAVCFGDSGGAAISATTNAILGVTSRISTDKPVSDAQPSSACVGAQNVFTSLVALQGLVDQAFAAAGAKPLLEGGADGDAATLARSGSRPSAGEDASDDEPKPKARSARHPSSSAVESQGCSAAPASTAGGSPLVLALGALLVLRARRRRA